MTTGSAARAAPCGRRTTAAAQPQTRRRPRQQRWPPHCCRTDSSQAPSSRRHARRHASDSAPRRPSVTRLSLLRCSPVAVEARPLAAPMAGTGRLAARRKARLLPTGRVAHGLAQRSRAVHPLPPPRLETEQRSSPPPLPPPCAVRPTRRHSAPRHCSTWGPTAASAAAAAAGPTAAAPFQIRLGAGTQDGASQAWNLQLRSPETGTHAYGTYWRGPTLTVRGPTVAIPPVMRHLDATPLASSCILHLDASCFLASNCIGI